MSYRLKATAPCNIFVAGASYQVQAGDRLHLSNEDGAAVLAGPARSKFVVIEFNEEQSAAPISEQSTPGGFFSDGILPTVPSREQQLYGSEGDTSEGGTTAAVGAVDNIDKGYDEYAEQGAAMFNAMTQPKVKSEAAVELKAESTEPVAPKVVRGKTPAKATKADSEV